MFLLSFDSSLLLRTLKNMLAWGEDGNRKHHHSGKKLCLTCFTHIRAKNSKHHLLKYL